MTQEQRGQLDAWVLAAIRRDWNTASMITARLGQWLEENLPVRDDRYRYVDGALQRLRKLGDIHSVRQQSTAYWHIGGRGACARCQQLALTGAG